ncbi:MAG TPA: hypothetical protein VLA69_05330 [Gaiellaceae bacterium]|nr:hypothetical protein [Gaiellaceae bacterium]
MTSFLPAEQLRAHLGRCSQGRRARRIVPRAASAKGGAGLGPVRASAGEVRA